MTVKLGLFYVLPIVRTKVVSFFDQIVTAFRASNDGALAVTEGEIAPHSRRTLCVFAHFDRDNIVDDYVVYYLRALNEAGAEIIFCSTAEQLSDAEIRKVKPYCRVVIVRRNIGYDFASYRVGLSNAGDLSSYEQLILANDSAYGPIRNLGKVLERMAHMDADFWGITDSMQFCHHIQSYFLVFSRTVFLSPVFRNFWRRFPNYLSKRTVIAKGEIGLSQALVREGFRMWALCPYSEIEPEDRDSIKRREAEYLFVQPAFNPTHFDWKTLIERYGCPFIKIELLRDNPQGIASADEWESILSGESNYDISLIRHHLQRVRPDHQ